jgi:NADH-quinone oxidoreductase subunit I
MRAIFNYFSEIFNALKHSWGGLKITGKYFISPRQIITQQYPENRSKLEMFDRFKGEVILKHDENNFHRCNGCGICQTSCPNGSIEILTDKIVNSEGKTERIIDKHVYHLSMCTFCGLCVKNCPSDALAFSQEFEHAVFDRQKLTKILNQPGSKLKKEPKAVKEEPKNQPDETSLN